MLRMWWHAKPNGFVACVTSQHNLAVLTPAHACPPKPTHQFCSLVNCGGVLVNKQRRLHPDRSRSCVCTAAQQEPGTKEDSPNVQTKDLSRNQNKLELAGSSLVTTSILFYGAMTVAALALSQAYGYQPIASQLSLQSFDAAAATAYLGLFFALLATVSSLGKDWKDLQEIEQFFKMSLLPLLVEAPWWAIPALALGAGVGEEFLFRGFMQSTLAGYSAATLNLDPTSATAISLATTSIVFGALHALNSLYFAFATVAGTIFGLEYESSGLWSAAVTHFLYDWAVIAFTVEEAKGTEWVMKVKRAVTGEGK